MDIILFAFLLIVFILLANSFRQAGAIESRSQVLVQCWARENGFEILEMRRPSYPRDYWTIGYQRLSNQIFYIIEVQNRQGQKKEALIRCGDWLGRMTMESMRISWRKK